MQTPKALEERWTFPRKEEAQGQNNKNKPFKI
jgi:hypothetical protein